MFNHLKNMTFTYENLQRIFFISHSRTVKRQYSSVFQPKNKK